MVATTKTWTSTLNVDLGPAAADREAQYREMVFNIKQQFLLAGWTVTRCSDGVNVSNSDLWLTSANIVRGTGSRSWIALDSPNGYANYSGASRYALLIDARTTSTWLVEFNLATASYTSGTISTLPTTTGVQSGTWNMYLPYVNSTGLAVQSYINFWRTSNGDVFWLAKQQSTEINASFGAVHDGTNARHITNRILISSSGVPSGQPGSFRTVSTAGCAVDNSTFTSAYIPTCRATGASNWTAGEDSSGDVGYFPILLIANSNSIIQARDYGILPDFWGVAANTPNNAVDVTDTDPYRLLTMCDIALPTAAAQGSMQ